jgi:hypothetical protein
MTLYRSRASLTVNAVASLITTYWQSTSPVSDVQTATEAMARVRAMFNSAASRVFAGSTLTFDPAIQILDETTGELVNVAVGTPPAAVSFLDAGDALPGQVQGLAKYGTSSFIGGRNVKGRFYIPGPTEGDNGTAGVPSSAYLTAWNTALGLLGTTVVSAITQVVWHRPTIAAPSSGSTANVTSRVMATTWATQRRRGA